MRMLFWLALAIAVAVLLWFMVKMPGASFAGDLPPLSAEERHIAEKLRRHVEAIGGREHNMFRIADLAAAAEYIERTLRELGHRVETQRVAGPAGEARNIEVEIPGSGEQAGLVIAGAHYDSVVGSPGANDNGSGVAALLELSRLLSELRPARTLRLVWFVNEEPPFFKTDAMGSRRYAVRLRERGECVAAMYSIETVGFYSDRPGTQRYPFPLGFFYPDTGNFLAFVSNLGSRALLHQSIASFRRHAAFPSEGVAAPAAIPGVDWSDHWSFWAEGWPAVMVTDTAPYRYPFYHSAEDTPEKVDFARLARVTAGLAAMLRDVTASPSTSRCAAR